jgi:hypothetical protein
MSEDLSLRRAIVARAYAEAIARRNALDPRDPAYHDAVLDVGHRWSQLRYWERRIEQEASQRPGGDDLVLSS